MHFFRRPRSLVPALQSGCVITVGVFDGVHLGHQKILGQLLNQARLRRLPSLVLSFEPTPQECMNPANPPARLMRLREKFQVLNGMGIDHLFCPPFGRLQNLSPEVFIETLLVKTLGVRHVVVGEGFRFGQGRVGTFADLEAGGRRWGFGVEQVESVTMEGERVSSTAVRKALAAGDMSRARRLLGRPYRMEGRVCHGQKLGRTLDFPTANLRLQRRVSPVSGIFAVRVYGVLPVQRGVDGVASVGTRPTVNGVEPLLEVHIFDFYDDVYGWPIAVEFLAHLRAEAKFTDLEELRQQMEKDAVNARLALCLDRDAKPRTS